MLQEAQKAAFCPPPAGLHRLRLFGLDFDDLTQAGLVDRIGAAIRSGERCWVVTVNVHTLCLAERDPAFRTLLRSADLLTADGMPILWISRLRERPLRERVTGSDLLVPLAARAAAEGWRLFVCGGPPGVADQVADSLRAQAPELRVVGTASPELPTPECLTDPERNRELLAAIRSSKPDVLLVAFGSPKQERWIAHHLASGALAVRVAIGVGASFDFLVGRQKRPPAWPQKVGLEWLHRMATQPVRLAPRYARDALTFAGLCVSELRRRGS
jgi:exopolysaccharide biosynthesis WecB/TagA/CpsF family protein